MEESEMKTSSPSEGSRQSTQEGPKGRKEEGIHIKPEKWRWK